MKRIIFSAILVCVVIASLGCISSPESKPKTLSTLRIGYQPTTHHVAEMVAMEMGWWKENLGPFGVKEIKEFPYPSGAPELKAMQDGDLDVAYCCTTPLIGAVSKGLDAKVVAGANTKGSDLVLRPGIRYEGPRSLIGLTIGALAAGTLQDILLKKWLSDNGINASEVNIVPMGPGDAVAAISEGRIHAAFLPQPAPAIIEWEGKGKSKVASGDMWPDHACCGVVVTGTLIREYPKLVEQIVKTQIKATEYINEHPEEAARIYSKYTGQNLSMMEYSIKTWDGTWLSDPHPLIESTVQIAQFQKKLNLIQKELSKNDLFDTSFYDKVR